MGRGGREVRGGTFSLLNWSCGYNSLLYLILYLNLNTYLNPYLNLYLNLYLALYLLKNIRMKNKLTARRPFRHRLYLLLPLSLLYL